MSVFDERINSAGMKTLQVIVSPSDDSNSLKYLQGLLASQLMNFYCVNFLADDLNQTYLARLPIRTIDFSDADDRMAHNKMVMTVEAMLAAQVELSAAVTEREINRANGKISSLDNRIDRLVYELYRLTDEEIAVVEAVDVV